MKNVQLREAATKLVALKDKIKLLEKQLKDIKSEQKTAPVRTHVGSYLAINKHLDRKCEKRLNEVQSQLRKTNIAYSHFQRYQQILREIDKVEKHNVHKPSTLERLTDLQNQRLRILGDILKLGPIEFYDVKHINDYYQNRSPADAYQSLISVIGDINSDSFNARRLQLEVNRRAQRATTNGEVKMVGDLAMIVRLLSKAEKGSLKNDDIIFKLLKQHDIDKIVAKIKQINDNNQANLTQSLSNALKNAKDLSSANIQTIFKIAEPKGHFLTDVISTLKTTLAFAEIGKMDVFLPDFRKLLQLPTSIDNQFDWFYRMCLQLNMKREELSGTLNKIIPQLTANEFTSHALGCHINNLKNNKENDSYLLALENLKGLISQAEKGELNDIKEFLSAYDLTPRNKSKLVMLLQNKNDEAIENQRDVEQQYNIASYFGLAK